ncbi:hypothetical protein AcdelDRAFT_0362 [Acidovorax delafieldii 2AN]|uniref:Uncharacterized protein n=1 Tax=Acidovorax delafieldii 2AN TaxID=573060 RepID=C5T0D2_ACIDE|nr:hypothetical protein AcdelDRAFT_0362 [Acidovorax delafieldii 2AN]
MDMACDLSPSGEYLGIDLKDEIPTKAVRPA